MTDFNPDEMTAEVVVEQLTQIAESGKVRIAWTDLQRALVSQLGAILESYQERENDNNNKEESQYEEPNVEKFNLENSRDEILELIASFSEPPFTIQRICELLCSPLKYYDRTGTFLRGLEKNLRVISTNDCPKTQVDEPKLEETTTTSNRISDINSSSIVNNSSTIFESNNDDNNNNSNNNTTNTTTSSNTTNLNDTTTDSSSSSNENIDEDDAEAAAEVDEDTSSSRSNNNTSDAESSQPLEQSNDGDHELEIESQTADQTQDVP